MKLNIPKAILIGFFMLAIAHIFKGIFVNNVEALQPECECYKNQETNKFYGNGLMYEDCAKRNIDPELLKEIYKFHDSRVRGKPTR
ncbi:MAG: hypothetical protein CMD90_02465 [Gammaproteobacteria bacterium]|nr:hypothetical protein [Gammaproteobacteria bacterium]|tara:strand:+ start:394 stop:651 length:258 start_codon:yes stop_codon:yes gene_type:complete